jgi:3-hydroxyacyl-[acyl-carrier-protein] dehydratase
MNIKGTFYFDPSDRIYAEHFPGHPVVPGSLIIRAFLKALKEDGINEEIYVIENFRFKEFISPGEYHFDIEICKDQMKCGLFRSSSDEIKPIVTGIITK